MQNKEQRVETITEALRDRCVRGIPPKLNEIRENKVYIADHNGLLLAITRSCHSTDPRLGVLHVFISEVDASGNMFNTNAMNAAWGHLRTDTLPCMPDWEGDLCSGGCATIDAWDQKREIFNGCNNGMDNSRLLSAFSFLAANHNFVSKPKIREAIIAADPINTYECPSPL
jgi:hypothetical protein